MIDDFSWLSGTLSSIFVDMFFLVILISQAWHPQNQVDAEEIPGAFSHPAPVAPVAPMQPVPAPAAPIGGRLKLDRWISLGLPKTTWMSRWKLGSKVRINGLKPLIYLIYISRL